ncbi:ArsR family transcriptional regulator, partial [bacterium]
MTATTDPEVNRRLKAIADPSRQAILKEAKRTPGISCGELVERLGLSQPTVSHHLK